MYELSVKCLLYTDDQVMNDSVKKMGMKVNINKTNVVVFERGENTAEYDIYIEVYHVPQANKRGGRQSVKPNNNCEKRKQKQYFAPEKDKDVAEKEINGTSVKE
ncbi:hypothetical protein EVAR_5381_1 [Eumeta japonica]|uniref:Uncharacterized protein n=1 Tax=Eumeta variegata TaxID=151549 RepID=A0A4C1TP07_EUMVA|nr:hypothetical protein EVAR_5381_1 [Eumeta japonica]